MFFRRSPSLICLCAILAGAGPAQAWSIFEVADQMTPCTSVACEGTGPASSTGTLVQFKWNDSTSTYQAYGSTSMGEGAEGGVIQTGEIGMWMSTARPQGTSYPVGQYKLKVLEDGADELFKVEQSP